MTDPRTIGSGAYSTAKLKLRFERLWGRQLLPGVEPDSERVRGPLFRHYAEDHRRYHTLRHLAHCLRQLDAARSLSDDPDAVEMAIWFHDVVHVPGATDNEQRSVELFERAAEGCLAPAFVTTVAKLILATTHRGTPQGRDEELIRDIDLSGIGSPWQRFLSDSKSLRAEQAGAPDEVFKAGKVGFLRTLLERRSIYFSEFFRARFEAMARSNIERYIARQGTGGRG